MRLIQLQRAGERRVAAVEEPKLRLLKEGVCHTIYDLAAKTAKEVGELVAAAEEH